MRVRLVVPVRVRMHEVTMSVLVRLIVARRFKNAVGVHVFAIRGLRMDGRKSGTLEPDWRGHEDQEAGEDACGGREADRGGEQVAGLVGNGGDHEALGRRRDAWPAVTATCGC